MAWGDVRTGLHELHWQPGSNASETHAAAVFSGGMTAGRKRTRNDPALIPIGGLEKASGVVTPAPALRPAQQQLLQRRLTRCGTLQKPPVSSGFSGAPFSEGRREKVNRGTRDD
jgi:hypothetical protein